MESLEEIYQKKIVVAETIAKLNEEMDKITAPREDIERRIERRLDSISKLKELDNACGHDTFTPAMAKEMEAYRLCTEEKLSLYKAAISSKKYLLCLDTKKKLVARIHELDEAISKAYENSFWPWRKLVPFLAKSYTKSIVK